MRFYIFILCIILVIIISFSSLNGQEEIIKKIEIVGNQLIEEKEIIKCLEFKLGDKFNIDNLNKSNDNIAKLYKNKNYLGFIDDYILKEGVLLIKIIECKIEKINIIGNEFVPTDEIMINILSKEGEVINLEKLNNDSERIYDLGHFKKVKYKLEQGKDKEYYIVNFIVDEIYKGKIVNIDIKGNNSIKKETILNCLNIELGKPITKEKLDENVAIIEAMGFFQVIEPEFNSTDDGIELVFHLKENPQVNKINFSGNTIFNDDKLRSIMTTKENEILNIFVLAEDRKRIEGLYLKSGYIATHVYDIGFVNNEVIFYIGEGVVEDIRVKGKKFVEEEEKEEIEGKIPEEETSPMLVDSPIRTKDYVIKREMKTKIGDVLKKDTFIRDLQRIYNLGYFKDVSYKITPGTKEGNVILDIIIVEKEHPNTLRFGAGYSSQFSWSGMLNFQHNNLFGKGRRVSLDLQFGGVTSYEISYHEPWLDKHHTSLGVSVFDTKYTRKRRYEKEGISEYEEKKRGFSLILGRPIEENTRINIGFEQKEVDTIHTGGVALHPKDVIKGKILTTNFSIVKDTRDNIFAATKGVRDSLFIDTSGGILGGDFDFTKYQIEGRRYLRIKGTKIVFATRMRLGLYKGKGVEEFVVGGVDTLRGYEENIWGVKCFVFNNEIRFPITDIFTGVLFVDFANAWEEEEKIKLEDIKSGVGFGIRLEVPGVGPIRLDWGRNLQTGETQTYFSFGHMF